MYIVHTSFVSFKTPLQFIACILQGFVDPKMQHGIQMAIYNKSYVWTTLADHVLQSDQEIYSLCGVKLVFLNETTYGIIRKIQVPNPDETQQLTPTSAVGHKKAC